MSRQATNETGNRYGLLHVIGQAGRYVTGHVLWRCRCDCGGERAVRGNELRCGRVRSCGCAVIRQRDVEGRFADEPGRTIRRSRP